MDMLLVLWKERKAGSYSEVLKALCLWEKEQCFGGTSTTLPSAHLRDLSTLLKKDTKLKAASYLFFPSPELRMREAWLGDMSRERRNTWIPPWPTRPSSFMHKGLWGVDTRTYSVATELVSQAPPQSTLLYTGLDHRKLPKYRSFWDETHISGPHHHPSSCILQRSRRWTGMLRHRERASRFYVQPFWESVSLFAGPTAQSVS